MSLPTVKELRESFSRVNEGSDRLQQEYDLLREAEYLDIPLDTYRRLYELRSEEPIPRYPKLDLKTWWRVPIDCYRWSVDLPSRTKWALVGKGINKAIEKGVLLSVTAAVIHYLWTIPARHKQALDQRKQAHYQAWQIVNSASGQQINGGRIEALQDLAKDNISLAGLSARKTYLEKVELEGSNLEEADLSGSDLEDANLNKAVFIRTNLSKTNLRKANLKSANLFQANLSKASLDASNFNRANLNWANLDGAELREVNFSQASLSRVNFSGDKLYGANFKEADLDRAIFQDAELCGIVNTWSETSKKVVAKWECADFRGAKNLTSKQIQAAKNWEKSLYDPEMRRQLGLQP